MSEPIDWAEAFVAYPDGYDIFCTVRHRTEGWVFEIRDSYTDKAIYRSGFLVSATEAKRQAEAWIPASLGWTKRSKKEKQADD